LRVLEQWFGIWFFGHAFSQFGKWLGSSRQLRPNSSCSVWLPW
jgi:hypothetical protein